MSKILPATANALGIVTADGVPVTAAQILSLGKQQSSGLLFLDGDKAWYFPSSATDIKTTITKLSNSITSLNAALTQIATTLTSIGAGMLGPATAPPPTLAADVLVITGKVTELVAIKAELETLKEALK